MYTNDKRLFAPLKRRLSYAKYVVIQPYVEMDVKIKSYSIERVKERFSCKSRYSRVKMSSL